MLNGAQVKLFDARLSAEAAAQAPGTVVAAGDTIDIALTFGVLRVMRLQASGGKKIAAAEFAAAHNVTPGACFEDGVAAPPA
jgi:methionyl-tRNA formyltransferase